VSLSLFAAQHNIAISLVSGCHRHHSVKHLGIHEDICRGQKIVHVHHSEKHSMEQAVILLGTKNYTNHFVAINSDFVFSSIIITNIQKTLNSSNSRANHTYIISEQ